jgi:integrase
MSVFKRKVKGKEGKITDYWYYEVSLSGGKKIKKSVGKVGLVTKAMAREEETELKKKIRRKQLDMVNADIPTLNDIKGEYLEYVRDVKKKRSWKRDDELLRPLCELFGNKLLSDITTNDLEEFKLIRLKKVSPATVNRSLSVLRHLFNLAKRWNKFYGDNPVSIVGMLEEHNQVERILTLDEENRLLNEAISYLRPILKTALNTGMRRGEILSLKWSDVDLNNNLIIISQTNSKSKKLRKIYINSVLKKEFAGLKLKSGGNEYVFLSDKRMRLKEIKNGFNAACKRAGIEGLRFHDLRHTAATRMVESGGSIVAVSKILGHSDIKTTMRYTHPDNSLKDALENLANFGKSTTNITTNTKVKINA